MTRKAPGFSVAASGDSAFLVRLGTDISETTSDKVMAVLGALDAARAETPGGFVDVVPGYATVLVVFDPLLWAPARAVARIRHVVAEALAGEATDELRARRPVRVVEIPVLYDAAVAPDLVPLAEEKGLDLAAFVALHTAPLYRCHMLGFRPGFPFLGGLDARLATPRLATPRLSVAAGSVGIGGVQTGVYPTTGPGGWRVIGRTPMRLFDSDRVPPFLVEPGDRVRFVAVDRTAFEALERDSGSTIFKRAEAAA